MKVATPHQTNCGFRINLGGQSKRTHNGVVELTSGAIFAFPPALVQGLRDATPADLAEIEVSPASYGLPWPRIDEDCAVPELMNGVLGTARWMVARAGRATSSAAAARGKGRKAAGAGG